MGTATDTTKNEKKTKNELHYTSLNFVLIIFIIFNFRKVQSAATWTGSLLLKAFEKIHKKSFCTSRNFNMLFLTQFHVEKWLSAGWIAAERSNWRFLDNCLSEKSLS